MDGAGAHVGIPLEFVRGLELKLFAVLAIAVVTADTWTLALFEVAQFDFLVTLDLKNLRQES